MFFVFVLSSDSESGSDWKIQCESNIFNETMHCEGITIFSWKFSLKTDWIYNVLYVLVLVRIHNVCASKKKQEHSLYTLHSVN